MAKLCINRALEKLNLLRHFGREITLKKEQEIAVENLLLGKDVLAVLPTGFGKSMIYTIYLLAKQELERQANEDATVCIVIISPLSSIICDQIAELESLDFTALELTDKTLKDVVLFRPQFIYCSAENATKQSFLDALRGELHNNVAAIVVDESHTVETWTGKRKNKGKKTLAFRSAFGNIAILRSMCKKECPVLALTGTADAKTQEIISKDLVLKQPCKLFVSPNRPNLRFLISKVKKKDMLGSLDWLVSLIKEYGISTPKTIIFCDTLYAVANVANYMTMKLGSEAFHPSSSTNREDCLLGIMHSTIPKKYKERLFQSLKGDGTKRVAIATTSLSMGVNFPDILHVVMFGLPRSMLDLHQQAGRGGRDGLPTDVSIIFYGQQVSHCDDDIRAFINDSGCWHVAAYSIFDSNIAPSLPAHDCCSFCLKTSLCNPEGCGMSIRNFECLVSEIPCKPKQKRIVSDEDKKIVELSLQEMINGMFPGTTTPFGATSLHGFSQELVCDVVAICENIFTEKDIFDIAPTFSKQHAYQILGLLSENFDDIDESALCGDEAVDDEHCKNCDKLIGLNEIFDNFEDLGILSHDFHEEDFLVD